MIEIEIDEVGVDEIEVEAEIKKIFIILYSFMWKLNKLLIIIVVLALVFLLINPALIILLPIAYIFLSRIFPDFNNIIKDIFKYSLENSNNILWSEQNKDYRKELLEKENEKTSNNMESIKEDDLNYKKDDLKNSKGPNLGKKEDKISFGTWFSFDEKKFFKH